MNSSVHVFRTRSDYPTVTRSFAKVISVDSSKLHGMANWSGNSSILISAKGQRVQTIACFAPIDTAQMKLTELYRRGMLYENVVVLAGLCTEECARNMCDSARYTS